MNWTKIAKISSPKHIKGISFRLHKFSWVLIFANEAIVYFIEINFRELTISLSQPYLLFSKSVFF